MKSRTLKQRNEALERSAGAYEKLATAPLTMNQQLALDRTHLAVARTFLAWLRTSMAVMGAAVALVHIDRAQYALVSAGFGVVALLVLGWAVWDLRGWARVLPDSSVSRMPIIPYFIGALIVALIFVGALIEPLMRN